MVEDIAYAAISRAVDRLKKSGPIYQPEEACFIVTPEMFSRGIKEGIAEEKDGKKYFCGRLAVMAELSIMNKTEAPDMRRVRYETD